MEREQVATWIETLRIAWEDGDSAGAAALFTEDATYHNDPFAPPVRGREEIERYWAKASAANTGLSVRMGMPLTDDNRAAVEWWSQSSFDGADSTDCGVLVLTFDGGRCKDLREYWNLADRKIEPQSGWGI